MKGHITTWDGGTKTTQPRTKKPRCKLGMSDKAKRAIQPRKACCEIVRKRSGGYCEARMHGCTVRGDHFHEVIPRSQGGSITDPENVRHFCWHCHHLTHQNPNLSRKLGFLKDNHKPKTK